MLITNFIVKNVSHSLRFFTKDSSKSNLFTTQYKSFFTAQNIRNEMKTSRIAADSVLLNQQTRYLCTVDKNSTKFSSKSQNLKKRCSRKTSFTGDGNHKSMNVIAYATADEYNLEKLRLGLLKDSPYIPTDIEDFHRTDLLYTETSSSDESEEKQIFFFPEGAVVFWNVSDEQCKDILKYIKHFEISSYSTGLVLSEKEVMQYSFSEDKRKSDLVNGEIVLASNIGNVPATLDRYTFSNALMLSVKLGVWEGLLEEYITSIEVLTGDIRNNKISISRDEVFKKTGELFALRHTVNLSSDVLDIPDFYWDREELENLYVKMCNYLSISLRTKVVNEKLNHCLELLDLVSSHLNDRHHVRLEWMIIILIVIEVCIAIIHMVFVPIYF